MKRIGDLIAVVAFSVAALLVFHFVPEIFPNDDLNSILQYSLMGGSFIYFIWAYQLPTMQYFRLPAISFSSLCGLGVVVFYAYSRIDSSDGYTLPLWPTITGVVYLYAIGLGEEVVSRGFIFGVLKKYGTAVALIFSSIAFGLMHLNVYLGDDWNPVNAYWHCLSAAGFGFLAAAVMLAMKSILPAIIMHALFDWPVVFSPPSKEESSDYVPHFDPLWQTIKDSFAEIMIDVCIGLVLILSARGIRFKRIPRLVMRGLLKFRLVEEG